MKKLLALILTLCMVAMLVPAMAEEQSEGGLGALLNLITSLTSGSGEDAAEEDASAESTSSEDIGGLMDLVGGVLNGDGASDISSSEGVGALLGMLGNKNSAEAKPVYNTVAAESIDQFYGTWEFSKAVFGSTELSMSLLSLLGTTGNAKLTLGDNSIDLEGTFGDLEKSYHVDSTEESKYVISMELVDGALNVTLDGDVIPLKLTDDDQLLIELEGVGTAFFTRGE